LTTDAWRPNIRERVRPTLHYGRDIIRRSEHGSILLTSNRSPSEWAEVFGDALLASAALDRLTHHVRVTVIAGESYGQRHRRKEVKPNPKPTKKQ
jgi:DNA replication protein DnaC